jgi:hypothetical protein
MQTRVHRNTFYYVIPIVLFGISSLLLLWSIIRLNIPDSVRTEWPWKVQLLDIQSATTATTIAGGLVFARAQYATAVRPMISWMSSVIEAKEFSSEFVWLVRVVNGSTSPASFHYPEYRVILNQKYGDRTDQADPIWISYDEATALLNANGLRYGVDYSMPFTGQGGTPLSVSSQYHLILGIFTQKALRIVDDVLVRVKATDQAGDTHQRIIYCMRGAVRNPKSASVPFST